MFPPIPVGDENPSRRRPIVTWALIGVNVLVFLAVNAGRSNDALAQFFESWGFSVARPLSVQLVTALFLHGNLLHLVGNMWILWIVGDNVEDKLGHGGFLLLYLVGGVIASWAFVATSSFAPDVEAALAVAPALARPLVGASGAIFAVMGVYVVFFPQARIKVLLWFFVFLQIIPVRAKWIIGAWFLQDLILTMMARGPAYGGVATAAHLGGAGFGMLAGLWLKPRVGGGGEGGAWDVHTGFAKVPAARLRVLLPGARRVRIPLPDPTESQLVGVENAIIREVRAGRLQSAIHLYPRYEALRREKPLPGDVQIDIAHEFLRQSLPRAALEAYLRYLETVPRGPDVPEAVFRVGVLFAREFGMLAEAVPWLQRAVKEHPDPEVRDFCTRELAKIDGAG